MKTNDGGEPPPNSDLVIYDGDCAFCRQQINRLAGWDRDGILEFISLHDQRIECWFPDLKHDDLMSEIVVVDRTSAKHGGADAVRYMAKRLPRLRWLAWLMHIPGSMTLWRSAYTTIAQRRYRIGGAECQLATCKPRTAIAAPHGSDRPSKALVCLYCACLLGIVLWPVGENWAESPQDDFPLSYYPMFSAKRGKTYRVPYIIGHDQNGTRVPLSYKLAGSGGFNQVRRQLTKIAKSDDPDQQNSLCQEVATRIARKPKHDSIVSVSFVYGSFLRHEYFAEGRKDPVKEKLLATTPIWRGPS